MPPGDLDGNPSDLGDRQPVLVVDAANVVGSVPDGWWRDRRGATKRLRDRLADIADSGVAGLEGPVHIVLVVEGRARGIASTASVTVVDADGSGDDAIVDVVARTSTSQRAVVTADRELRCRVTALGAIALGPSVITRYNRHV
ncbi:hypothetical protein EF294_17380 [Gordonia oryzae]|uniref:NTP pyrophosphohydrolase n=1 Tax=Gordonia oryzae TaxID=2487349 RepID=A0A3N4G912_9ACTN|nr:hypothetical protein [Gordonia oryzae]RPA57847.1 hypothetical protein EF294_17380 [Gordonia oryzae]